LHPLERMKCAPVAVTATAASPEFVAGKATASAPGLVADLGCGTGRALLPLVRRGHRGLAVDLSPHMLRIVDEKAAEEGLPVRCVLANLVELDCLRDDSLDYAICLFSTLGMIRGRNNRRCVLGHVRRILKPGGLFCLHVHNTWSSLFNPAGRAWLARHLLALPFRRKLELGDKFYPYRAIPNMFLHTFTRGELVRELRRAGFRIRELIPLAVHRQRPLRWAWLFGRLRANGWIAVCR